MLRSRRGERKEETFRREGERDLKSETEQRSQSALRKDSRLKPQIPHIDDFDKREREREREREGEGGGVILLFLFSPSMRRQEKIG